ncbi:MAG: ParA family protein [Spirochaetaceae bacterium]|jgi:cellulose biosynthesis protein BcsQ|nr:ParA family protein [Spirochaetaceae bacterium]
MIITAASPKGGTGKTTLNVLLAILMAARSKRILIIDLDASCGISQCFGQILKDATSMEFLSGIVENFTGIYHARENIDIIPGNIKNMLLNNIMDSQLKIALRRSGLADKYDYIIIDPPGYWGSHLRNAVFAADVLVIPANCSRIDFEVTRLFFDTLKECDLGDKEIFVCVNSYGVKSSLPGIIDLYKQEFDNFLLPFTIPYIQSLKRLTDNVDYPLNAAVKKRLALYADYITGNAIGGEKQNDGIG